MPKALTVLPIHAIKGVLQLLHILAGAGIQCFLHHRLFRTAATSESGLQGRITSQTRIDFDQPVRSGQHRDEAVDELLDGSMLDRLLCYVDFLSNGTEHIQVLQLHSNGGQTRS
jgi:hypothetical protein